MAKIVTPQFKIRIDYDRRSKNETGVLCPRRGHWASVKMCTGTIAHSLIVLLLCGAQWICLVQGFYTRIRRFTNTGGKKDGRKLMNYNPPKSFDMWINAHVRVCTVLLEDDLLSLQLWRFFLDVGNEWVLESFLVNHSEVDFSLVIVP